MRDSRLLARLHMLLLLALLSGPVPTRAAGEQILSDDMEGGFLCTSIAPSTVVVDVRSSLLRPTFRHNGAPFPADALNSGRFYLLPREGQPIALGSSATQPTPAIRVLNGVYDVEYRWQAGDQVPRNFAARILQNVVVAGSRDLLVDVPSTTLSGALTMNGDPFPQAGAAAASLSLQGIHGLGGVFLATSNEANYTVRLIPGAYNLRYQSPGSPGPIPANQDALRERVDVEPNTAVRDFDIPAVITQFLFRVDGVPAPASLLENGRLSLRTAARDRVDLGESRSQVLTLRLIPGRYEAWWEGIIGAELVPANADSRFDRIVDVAPSVVVLDVPTRVFAGDFLFNGAPAPALAIESGRVWIRDPLSGADVLLGSTSAGQFSRRLIPGAYDLVYAVSSGSEIVPANAGVVFERGRVVNALPAADVDIPVAPLAWNLTLNGAAFPDLVLENARIRTRSPDDLEDILLGDTRLLGAIGSSRRLVPASYRPTYSRLIGSELVPANSHASIDGNFELAPGGGALKVIDLAVGSWNFMFRNNGVPFANDLARRARFALRHRDDEVALGSTDSPAGPRLLISNVLPLADGRTGTVHYTWLAGGATEMPRNIDQPVSCHVLTP